ncbi:MULTISPECIES: copper chaperone PCu(A)C [Vibrio]|uniref:Copper chaperone PCu(A)C n=1 Tax=Vibrio casei TaxID=673372 RepID=A0A368LIH2_9VIBR|nr:MULTISPECIES: copper chaperone PCu(A)C [Vibrio]RCS70507.1 copper chaperone PCu(A)C [Vibrio casei]SJN27930.1 Copper metallochaperone, bacterial analog of Cox17 protein [Vibrio casei]HBV77899.1 copper chaperone PCu(A)C [Vibrio sp.]
MKLKSLALSSLLISSSVMAHDGMKYDDPYARATPPNAVNSAIFMTIENHMASDRTLVTVATPAAEKSELHTVERQGDLMKMRQVDGIKIPAHGEIQLMPGSFHIMLLNVNKPLVEDDSITLTLGYANGEKETLSVPVKKVITGMMPMKKTDDSHSHHNTAN